MKKVVLIVFLILLGGEAFSQKIKVTPCHGNTSKSADAFTKSIYFSAVGINLNKYDWQNPDVNCHINSVLSNKKESLWIKNGAYVLAGIGVGLLAYGLSSPESPYGDINKITKKVTTIGVVMVGGAIPLYLWGNKKKKKANEHLMEVSDYYRQKGLQFIG